MRSIFKLQRTVTVIIVAFLGFASFGAGSAHAMVNNYLFGETGSGLGTEELVINGTTVIQATVTGWNASSGETTVGATPPNSNYLVGDCAACGVGGADVTYRNFFSFDLSGVTGPITSAYLSIFNPGSNVAASEGFVGVPSTYVIHDASSFEGDLLAGTNVPTTYNDIASGTVFGSQFIDSLVNGGGNGSQVQVLLNSFALSSLLANEGRTFTVGGAFGAISTVPLPAGLPMFVLALLAVFGAVKFGKRRTFA